MAINHEQSYIHVTNIKDISNRAMVGVEHMGTQV